MKISVIIPVYKVEKYLRKCVDSVISQTHYDLEIILIDDGSPDRCPEICDYYATLDPRVNVIHKSNGGLSDARNAGLEVATGEWLSFIDSDDWIEPEMYEKLLDNAEQYDAQVSVGGVVSEYETLEGINRIISNELLTTSITTASRIEAIKSFLCNSWSAWDKIYRHEVFDGIRYPVGEINEDEAIALRLLNNCDRVVYTNEPFYHYISRPESITTSSFSLKKLDWYRHCKANLEWIRDNHPELEELAAARYRGCLMWTLTEIALSDVSCPEEQQDMISELRNKRSFFLNISFDSAKEKIRFLMLSCLPFSIYRAFIRKKRKI